jgi:hypothetical protein
MLTHKQGQIVLQSRHQISILDIFLSVSRWDFSHFWTVEIILDGIDKVEADKIEVK